VPPIIVFLVVSCGGATRHRGSNNREHIRGRRGSIAGLGPGYHVHRFSSGRLNREVCWLNCWVSSFVVQSSTKVQSSTPVSA
jgi:hypothetical protein